VGTVNTTASIANTVPHVGAANVATPIINVRTRVGALEERHELAERHRAVRGQPLGERYPLHPLHRDPEQPVVLLDAERVDVGGVGGGRAASLASRRKRRTMA